MTRIPVMPDEDVAALLGDSPEEIAQSVHEILVLELYRRHVVSAGWAAEKLNRDMFEFIRWSGSLGIPYFDMTPEEWQQELRALKKMEELAKRSETPSS